MVSPKHEQLRIILLREAKSHRAHEMLPTERELAERHGVSRTTIRRALEQLEESGIVYRIQGAGTFISESTYSKTLRLGSFSEDMRERGLEPSSRILGLETINADGELARALAVEEGALVHRLARLRLADGEPICLETAHVSADRFPDLTEIDLRGSLYELLETRYEIRLTRADQTVTATLIDPDQATALAVAAGSAALKVHRLTLDQRDRPIEATDSIYRADTYNLRFTVRRS